MRTAASGFILGFAVISFLIVPLILYASGAARDYTGGLVIVMDQTGMLGLLQRGARQSVEFYDHAMWALNDFLNREVVPLIRPQQN